MSYFDHTAQPLTRVERWGLRASRLLEGLLTRVFLSICIAISLIPHDGPWARIADWVFLCLFSAEFVLRILSLQAPRGDGNAPGRRKLSTYGLLLVDFAALITYVPWTDDRTLRLLRLIRIVLLLGYWAPVLRDIAAILRREDRSRQIVLMGFAVLTVALVGAVILDALAVQGVDFDNDGKSGSGDGGFLVRLWWAFRQIQDPGNMIATPLHAAAVLVSLTLTVFGLFMVSFLIGLGTSVVGELVQLNRNRPPGFHDHTVIVGENASTPRLLLELLRYYRKLFSVPRYALLGTNPDRPDYLDSPQMSHVVYRNGVHGEPGFLKRVDVLNARRVVLMPDLSAANPDAETAGLILSVREHSTSTPIVAEIVDLANAPAARVAGGRNTTLVGTERLLGLVMFAAVHRPGLIELIDTLLSSEGREIYTYIFDRPDAVGNGSLPCTFRPRLDALTAAALRSDADERIIPLGFITFDADHVETPPAWTGYVPPATEAIYLNRDIPADVRHLRGIIAIAERFPAIERFAQGLWEDGVPQAVTPDASRTPIRLDLRSTPAQPSVRRVVIFGYRPASLSLIEALVAAHPGVEILLCVHNRRGRQRVTAALREHSLNLTDTSFPGQSWRFDHGETTRDYDAWRCVPKQQTMPGECVSTIRVQVTDWTNDATLSALPGWGCSIGEIDAAFLIGGLSSHSDGWTALAVLKIAEIHRRGNVPFKPNFQLMAQINDPAMGRRLETRFTGALGGRAHIHVLSSRTLRSFAMLQGLAVPAFESVYSELLGPWGQGFVRLDVEVADIKDVNMSFGDVTWSLREHGKILIAVELRPMEAEPSVKPRLVLCPGSDEFGATFDARTLVAVWVIAETSKTPSRHAPA